MARGYRRRRSRYRVLAALLWLLGIPALIGTFIGTLELVESYLWWPLIIVIGPVAFLLLAIATAGYNDFFERHVLGPSEGRDLRALQGRRDRWVRRHQQALLDGRTPFCLYLRPFASAGAVRVLVHGSEIGLADKKARYRRSFPSDYSVKWEDLEAILADAVRPLGSLVALGRPGEQFGAGRWQSDDDGWQELVSQLVERAELVFIVPSRHRGTLWELEQLLAVDGWRTKSVVVVPSDGDDHGYRPSVGGQETFRQGSAADPDVEVATLRDDALRALVAVGAPAASRRAARNAFESFLLLDADRRVSAIEPVERRPTAFRRDARKPDPVTGRRRPRPRPSPGGWRQEYLPSHGSSLALERHTVRTLVVRLACRARSTTDGAPSSAEWSTGHDHSGELDPVPPLRWYAGRTLGSSRRRRAARRARRRSRPRSRG